MSHGESSNTVMCQALGTFRGGHGTSLGGGERGGGTGDLGQMTRGRSPVGQEGNYLTRRGNRMCKCSGLCES